MTAITTSATQRPILHPSSIENVSVLTVLLVVIPYQLTWVTSSALGSGWREVGRLLGGEGRLVLSAFFVVAIAVAILATGLPFLQPAH